MSQRTIPLTFDRNSAN